MLILVFYVLNCICFLVSGRNYVLGRGIHRFSTTAALEEPIAPPVQINYTKLLINGQFVDSASGNPFFAYSANLALSKFKFPLVNKMKELTWN